MYPVFLEKSDDRNDSDGSDESAFLSYEYRRSRTNTVLLYRPLNSEGLDVFLVSFHLSLSYQT